MTIPEELYSVSTLFTLSGSAAAVWVVTAVVGSLFPNRDTSLIKRWLALVIALGLSILGAFQLETGTDIRVWIVAIVNGLVIYLTAVGGSAVVSGLSGSSTRPAAVARGTSQPSFGRRFAESWF